MSSPIDSTIQSIKNKIFTLIGRAILKAIDNTTKTATIQVTGLKGETITGIEYFSPYGFEAMPSEGQVAIMFINGNRDHGIALALHNRDERPTDLELDESQLWSKFGNYVKCNKDGEIEITGSQSYAKCNKSGEVEINGNTDYAVAYNDLKTAFDKLKSDLNTFIGIYNSHTHATAAIGAPSAPSAPGAVSTADMSPSKVTKVRLP